MGVTNNFKEVTAVLKIDKVDPSQLAKAGFANPSPVIRSILTNAPPNASCNTQELIISLKPVLSQVIVIKLSLP